MCSPVQGSRFSRYDSGFRHMIEAVPGALHYCYPKAKRVCKEVSEFFYLCATRFKGPGSVGIIVVLDT